MKKKASDFRYNTGETKVPWAAVGENYNADDLMAVVEFLMQGSGEEYDAALKAVCEKVMDIYFDAYRCNLEFVEKTDTTYTQKCSVCNATVTEISTEESYTLIITVNGKEVYSKTVYYK